MSGFSGRRGPNVSQYLADLNTIPSAQDTAADQNLNLEVEDYLFAPTNEFFDWDQGLSIPDITDFQYDPEQEERARRQNASAYRHNGEKNQNNHDFMNNNQKAAEFKPDLMQQGGDYSQFSGYNFPNLVDPSAAAAANFPANQHAQYQLPPQDPATSLSSPISPDGTSPVTTGDKRKLDATLDANGAGVIEEVSRLAAEEDKRRRNTAASARFRVKKKQREQALEKTAKEMSDKVGELETKINKLETENKWLKELLVEKNSKSSSDRSSSSSSSSSIAHKDAVGVRSTGDHTTGVGTDAKLAKA